MISGRRKAHHAHEINDAFAEGWDARLHWQPGQALPVNPYVPVPKKPVDQTAGRVAPAPRKQSGARKNAQQRDAAQWTQGWNDCADDLNRGDLQEIAPADFRWARENAPDIVDATNETTEVDEGNFGIELD